MRTHDNYFVFSADTNRQLGIQIGSRFKAQLQTIIGRIEHNQAWRNKLEDGRAYLDVTKSVFPSYIEELEGYASGAGVDFMDLWTYSLEDEFSYHLEGHCTTIITDDGKLISHNEDWAANAADAICVVQKTVLGGTILELHYYSTLGGNAASINSFGYIQCINTLTHSDWQLGVPRNVIARFMSETNDPLADFQKLADLSRASGYNHNLVSQNGQIWNIESTAKEQVLQEPSSPFIHTNHYLSERLKPYEAETGQTTYRRYAVAEELVTPSMTMPALTAVASDMSQGTDLSIFNERTIARMIIDTNTHMARIWLKREADKGWVDYPLDFITIS